MDANKRYFDRSRTKSTAAFVESNGVTWKPKPGDRWTIDDAACALSGQSHGRVSHQQALTWLESKQASGELDAVQKEIHADEVNALLQADPLWRPIVLARLQSPRLDDQRTVNVWNNRMQAAKWLQMASVSPREAAYILCCINPLSASKPDPQTHGNDAIDPRDCLLLERVFLDDQEIDPRRRTIRDWLDIAKARRCKHHSWFERYLAAVSRLGALPPPVKAVAAKEAKDDRCARLLREFEEERKRKPYGALSRVAKSSGRARQTVKADIDRGREIRAQQSNSIALMANRIIKH